MDDRRFDALTRALGGATTRRGALTALAALIAGGATPEAGAKRRRRNRCTPACASGQTCVQGACACDDGGAACGTSCCRAGQRCEGGACLDPAPACISPGEPCKDRGRACCDGRTCASGQGGKTDIACYRPAGMACGRTDECVYGTECREGTCTDMSQDWPDLPDESCVPNVAAGDAQGILRALREEGEARLAPGEYVFELGEGETAIELQRGARIIGCRGAEENARRGRDTQPAYTDWSVVCQSGVGVVDTSCVKLVSGFSPYSMPFTLLLRVQVVGRGSTSATRSIGLLDVDEEPHLVLMANTMVRCFNMGLVEEEWAMASYHTIGASFCGNLDGACFESVGRVPLPRTLFPACGQQSTSCSCGGGAPCTPNVAATGDAAANGQALLAQLATGDALLPAGTTYAFSGLANGGVAITINAARTIRACGGTATITCDGTSGAQNWKCILVNGGGALEVDGLRLTSTTGTSSNFAAGIVLFGGSSAVIADTGITGFANGLYNAGGTLACSASGNAICGNLDKNCKRVPNTDAPGMCSGCVAGNGAC